MRPRRILGLTVSLWPLAYPDLARLVRDAEDAGIDFVGLPDVAGIGTKHEALALVAALSATTSRIGLVPGVSLDFHDPFNLARALATLDHLSGGRIGWQGITCLFAAEAQNFGHASIAPEPLRRDRAAELLAVIGGLHDSWDDAAIPRDKASGIFFDRAGMRILSHEGNHFRVRGPLDVPTSPQRQLPLFGDLTFPELAERHADVLLAGDRDDPAAIRARALHDMRILRIVDADDPRMAERLQDETVDGVIVHCADPSGFVRNVLPRLRHRPAPHGTLREVLGLPPARSRHEETCGV